MSEVKEVYVMVSKYIHTQEWKDEVSGITFSKALGKIHIPQETDVRNIKRWLQQNLLFVISGDINSCKPKAKKASARPDNPAKTEQPEKPVEKPKAPPETPAGPKALTDMDVNELIVYASEHHIDIGKSTSKTGILGKIQAHKG